VSFTFRPAKFECSTLMLGISGPSGSGKTRSALRLASGLSPDKPIFLIDTENGRSLLYANRYKFQVLQMDAPFSPARYMEAIEAAVAAGAGAVIVDSMSHEHEGVGGILEMHEAELTRMAGQDWAKRERMKFSAWIKPKAEHNRLVNRVLQLQAHMIFCFRAKDKLVLVKNEKGRQEPVSVGWTPICADRFDYEMTMMLVLPPGSEGRPDLDAKSTKMNDDLAAIFHHGEQISEAQGAALKSWASGGNGPSPTHPQEPVATVTPPKKRTWADLLVDIKAKSDAVQDMDAALELANDPDVKSALKNGSQTIKDEVNGMLADAYGRYANAAAEAEMGAANEPVPDADP